VLLVSHPPPLFDNICYPSVTTVTPSFNNDIDDSMDCHILDQLRVIPQFRGDVGAMPEVEMEKYSAWMVVYGRTFRRDSRMILAAVLQLVQLNLLVT